MSHMTRGYIPGGFEPNNQSASQHQLRSLLQLVAAGTTGQMCETINGLDHFIISSALNNHRLCFSTTMKMQKSTAIIILALMVVSACLKPVMASPVSKSWTHQAESAEESCKGEVQTLCQRCAKSTKSPMVYPMCCANKEDARTWCHSYINFGIQNENN